MEASKATIKSLGRLKRRSDFLQVQNANRKWVSSSIVLQVTDNQDKICRFGITVSKKTSKLAVTRNRIKRRLRALAYDILPVLARPGVDYVLIGRAGAEDKSHEDLVKDLTWCLKRMDLQKDLA